jgi:hypothetical protein
VPRSTLTGSTIADRPTNPDPPSKTFYAGVAIAMFLTGILWLTAGAGVVLDASEVNLPDPLVNLGLIVALAATVLTAQLRAWYGHQVTAHERTRMVLASQTALKEDTGEIPKLNRALAQRMEPDVIVVPIPERHFEQVPDRERALGVLHAAETMIRRPAAGGEDGELPDEATWRAYLAGFYDRQNGQGDAGAEPQS